MTIRLIFISSLMFLFTFYQISIASSPEETGVLSVDATGKPFGEIINIIADQSGYNIRISEDLVNLEVKGKFQDSDIEKLFTRLLRGYNTFQIIDTGKKELLIFTDLRSNKPIYSSQPLQKEDRSKLKLTAVDIEISPGVNLAEVREKKKSFERKMQNNEVQVSMDESGKTLSEARRIRAQIERDINDNSIVVAISPDLTLTDARKIKTEFQSSNEFSNLKPGEGSGITKSELAVKQEQFAEKVRSGEIVIGRDDEVPGRDY